MSVSFFSAIYSGVGAKLTESGASFYHAVSHGRVLELTGRIILDESSLPAPLVLDIADIGYLSVVYSWDPASESVILYICSGASRPNVSFALSIPGCNKTLNTCSAFPTRGCAPEVKDARELANFFILGWNNAVEASKKAA